MRQEQISPAVRKYFTHLEFILGNELDWPETSFATGYKNFSWPTLQGYTDSLYFRLREHNLCNHRDYQNLAVNGADSEETIKYIKEISHNKTSLPVIAYDMMVNDICSVYMNSLDDLIKPEKFKKNVLKSLNFLENTLPPNSHVVLMGLVNGSFIYPTMAKHLHPLGQVNKDVTYDDLYNWFNFMKIGPCYQWLNKNETIRTATSKRGEELSNVLKQISVSYKFKSFKLHYMHNPLHQVMCEWQQSGYLIWEMLELSFSFHPLQKLHPFITKVIWRELVERNIVGKANPNNEMIQILFGNQGGH
ncbi:acyloxyacyl hydrolase-like [Centruroides sculpturatus]|uniref:acyloxyacyl hydrolase-like n=1 Tax=Centruroides sculpturatus TaxID=218467 RepID=UPI000C6D9592|nr:acyloxyacyl hydrolase-like [Centruroides sculpturatus]